MDKEIDDRALLIPAYNLLVNDGVWEKTPAERAKMTVCCKDGQYIPRVKNAGEVITKNGLSVQVMHNGLLVIEGGYQGGWQTKIIKELKGIHEPQEEKVFYEVLKRLPEDSVIIELGSWWAYYSLWLLKDKKKSSAICAEPDPENLKLARKNAELNEVNIKKRISYFESAAGSIDHKIITFQTEARKKIRVPIRTVDSIVAEEKPEKVDILHLDIQGAELEALRGAIRTIKSNKLRFVFISTHHYVISKDPLIHQKCLQFIQQNGGYIIAEHGILESYSGDGLIVASFAERDKDFHVEVSRLDHKESLFRKYEIDLDKLWEVHDRLVNYILKSETKSGEHIETIREELKRKSDHIDKVEGLLKEITPLRKHIKRQAKHRASRIKNKVRRSN